MVYNLFKDYQTVVFTETDYHSQISFPVSLSVDYLKQLIYVYTFPNKVTTDSIEFSVGQWRVVYKITGETNKMGKPTAVFYSATEVNDANALE